MLTPARASRLLARTGQTDSDLLARLTNAELQDLNTRRTGRPLVTVRELLLETVWDPTVPTTTETPPMPAAKPKTATAAQAPRYHIGDAYELVIRPLRHEAPKSWGCQTLAARLHTALRTVAQANTVQPDATGTIIAMRLLNTLGEARTLSAVRAEMLAAQADAA